MNEQSQETWENDLDYQEVINEQPIKNPAAKHDPVVIKQISIGIAMCLVAFSVVAFRTTNDLEETESSDPIVLALDNFAQAEEPEAVVSSSTTTTLEDDLEAEELDEEDEEPSAPVTAFSANRATCQNVYNNPSAVAFKFADPVLDEPVDEANNEEETTTTTTVKEETTTTTEKETTTTTEKPTTTEKITTTTKKPVAPPAPPGWADSGNGVNVPIELLVIRCCESMNNYTVQNGVSTASGAYQFLNGTWANQYGVSRAMYATPAQQDMAAIAEWKRNGSRPWNASKDCWGRGSA